MILNVYALQKLLLYPYLLFLENLNRFIFDYFRRFWNSYHRIFLIIFIRNVICLIWMYLFICSLNKSIIINYFLFIYTHSNQMMILLKYKMVIINSDQIRVQNFFHNQLLIIFLPNYYDYELLIIFWYLFESIRLNFILHLLI